MPNMWQIEKSFCCSKEGFSKKSVNEKHMADTYRNVEQEQE